MKSHLWLTPALESSLFTSSVHKIIVNNNKPASVGKMTLFVVSSLVSAQCLVCDCFRKPPLTHWPPAARGPPPAPQQPPPGPAPHISSPRPGSGHSHHSQPHWPLLLACYAGCVYVCLILTTFAAFFNFQVRSFESKRRRRDRFFFKTFAYKNKKINTFISISLSERYGVSFTIKNPFLFLSSRFVCGSLLFQRSLIFIKLTICTK